MGDGSHSHQCRLIISFGKQLRNSSKKVGKIEKAIYKLKIFLPPLMVCHWPYCIWNLDCGAHGSLVVDHFHGIYNSLLYG